MKGMHKLFCIGGIALVCWMAFFCFVNGNVQSLWIDELSSVGYIRRGLSVGDMMQTYLFCDTNMPLYSLILYFAYRILPYGEEYLLIPSILFCIAGTLTFAHTVKKINGERAGIIAICLCCASNALIWQGAWEVRCYSLVFLMATVTLECYVRKVKQPTVKNFIYYSIVALFFSMTHLFASIVLTAYGLFDIWLMVRKRLSCKSLIAYLPAVVFVLPWTLIALISKQDEIANFWGSIPEWKNMFWTILFLLSGRRVLWYICLLTGLLGCVMAVVKAFRKEKIADQCVLVVGCVLVIAWVIGIVFVYSRIINPNGSLYIERYFMVILPEILYMTVCGLEGLILFLDSVVLKGYIKNDKICKMTQMGGRIAVAVILIFSLGLCYREEHKAIREPFEEFREAADELVRDERIWQESTVFVGSNRYCALDGFIEYYFEKRGYQPPANIVVGGVNSIYESRFYPDYTQFSEEELLKYDVVIALRIHMSYDDEFGEFLEHYYIKVQTADQNGIEIWEKADKEL